MSINKGYHSNSNIFYRVWDHALFGLSADIGHREEHLRNLAEKGGDAILWTVGIIPRSIKAIEKSFQDPRVVTVALTALALFATTLLFYPASTLFYSKLAFTTFSQLITKIPFWAVKFSTYLTICASIVGAGLRAGGRFGNASLMKEFYGMPKEYPNNPSRLFAHEIAAVQQPSSNETT